MADLRDAVVKIQLIAGALTGMKEAPPDARLGVMSYPFAISYPISGTFDIGPAGCSKGIHRIRTEIHMAAEGDLPTAMKHLQSFLDDFANNVLNAPTLSGTVTTIVSGDDGPPITYSLRSGTFNNVPTVMLQFETAVKILNTIT